MCDYRQVALGCLIAHVSTASRQRLGRWFSPLESSALPSMTPSVFRSAEKKNSRHPESICIYKPIFIILLISFQNGGVVQTYVDGCCKTCKYSDGVVVYGGCWMLIGWWRWPGWVYGSGCWFPAVVQLSPAVLKEIKPPLNLLCLCFCLFISFPHSIFKYFFLLHCIQIFFFF